MTNREIVTQFLSAYQRHRANDMTACLDAQVEFSDVAFPLIKGERVRDMWRWFCQPFGERQKAIDVPEFRILGTAGDKVNAEYRVKYSPKPRRSVDYVIRSEFTLRDGRIVRQVDTPSISKFEIARMASGCRLTALIMPLVMRWKLDRFRKQKGAQSVETFQEEADGGRT